MVRLRKMKRLCEVYHRKMNLLPKKELFSKNGNRIMA